MVEFIERNKQIVELIDSGKKTISQLARELNLKRQRVSQIYYQTSGNLRGILKLRKREDIRRKKENTLDEVVFNCESCGNPVTRREGKHLSKYCPKCHIKNKKEQRDLNITLNCEVCYKKYHPFRTKRTQHNYCSPKCFHKSRRKDAS